MEHLGEISVEDLQQALDNVEGKKPAQRLLAAIAYKTGVTQVELPEWHDVECKTIYNWLKQLEAESLEHAVENAHLSGRKRKYSEYNNNNSAKRFTNRLPKPATMRRRGRRRSCAHI